MPIQHIDGSAALNRRPPAACIARHPLSLHPLSLHIRLLNDRNRLAIFKNRPFQANDILML
jgi:hypothetical protein